MVTLKRELTALDFLSLMTKLYLNNLMCKRPKLTYCLFR